MTEPSDEAKIQLSLEKYPELAQVLGSLLEMKQSRSWGRVTVHYRNGQISHLEISKTHKLSVQ